MVDVAVGFVRQLAGLVPAFARSVVYEGPNSSEFANALASRTHTVVHAAEEEIKGSTDCVVCFVEGADAPHGSHALQLIGSSLAENGCALLVELPGRNTLPLDELPHAAGAVGLTLYRNHGLSAAERPEEANGYIAFIVRAEYNPLLHARDLMQAGHWEWAFELLSEIPDEMQHDPSVAARIAAEKMVCLLAWDRSAGMKDRLARFFFSQATFYNAVSVAPDAREVYLCHGEFWKRIGDPSMRTRLLRSAYHGAPEEERRQIEATLDTSNRPVRDVTPPVWQAPKRLPRVLFVMHPRPHYGLDVLYDGLCAALGDANVVEYPFKPTLHGAKPKELAHYPCMFNRPGTALAIQTVLGHLSAGEFDLVIYGDLEGGVDAAIARAIVQAAGDAPVVLFDAQDDPLDHWGKMNDYVGGGLSVCFKREMLACWDYGEHTVPLPFAYADERIPAAPDAPRNTALFWAGHRQFGLRRLYLEHIERTFGFDLNKDYTQDEYSAALADARIGLNIFGFGFDTVRYWEIPAHGAMLLAERLPIHVPHDFVDGESAVFFDDLPALEAKLAYWLDRPAEAAAIAARGHEHLKRHHTASARARHMLGWVQARIPRWGR